MRRGRYLGLAVAVCLALSGCTGAKQDYKYRIAVIPKGTTHDFWKSIHAGAEKAAAERGQVKIIWEGPAREDQRQEQQNIIERFTSEDVSAIVLAPCDRQTLVAPVEATLKKGIPVVIIDSGLQETPRIKDHEKYLGYVATDNKEGGVQAAKRMAELLKGRERARVVMFRYQAGSESTEQREAGFEEEIRKHQNIQLLIAPEEAGATVDSAQKAAERLLPDHPDLDGIFAPNESSTTGVLQALRGLKRAGQVKFVGFDSSEILIKALKTEELHGLVLQDPFDMGYQSVLRALDFLEGKLPKDKVKNTNLQVATKENLDKPAIKSLIAPDRTLNQEN